MAPFKDKVVLITGGGTGLGFAMASTFGAQGAKPVIASRKSAAAWLCSEQASYATGAVLAMDGGAWLH